MSKIAIVVLADNETYGDLGRIVHALEAVKEFQEAGDEVQMIFDGAGTKWIGTLSDARHNFYGLYRAIESKITGVCAFYSNTFGVTTQVSGAGVKLVGEFDGHPSFKKLIDQGYQVITF